MTKILGLIFSFLLTVSIAQAQHVENFTIAHGWVWTLESGGCDTSLTTGDATDGAQGNTVFATCVGRNDSPIGTWRKNLTWEAMGVTVGHIVLTVDVSFAYRVVQESHAATQSMGALIFDSTGVSACTTSQVETNFDPGAPNAGYTVRNAVGVIAVEVGCNPSDTEVQLRLRMSPVSGNNASAISEQRGDDYTLTIVSEEPASGRRFMIISKLTLAGVAQ